MKVIYIAGPYTAKTTWEIECNVRIAEEIALSVAKLGAMPLCPHTNTRYFHGQCTPNFWYKGTMELLSRCDAILMCDDWDKSKGSFAEKEYAELNNMPIFYSYSFAGMNALKKWICE